jgi:hypothetical protein
MTLEIALALHPTAEDLALGLSDDWALADETMAAVEGRETSGAAKGIARIGSRRFKPSAAFGIATVMSGERPNLWGIKDAAI